MEGGSKDFPLKPKFHTLLPSAGQSSVCVTQKDTFPIRVTLLQITGYTEPEPHPREKQKPITTINYERDSCVPKQMSYTLNNRHL